MNRPSQAENDLSGADDRSSLAGRLDARRPKRPHPRLRARDLLPGLGVSALGVLVIWVLKAAGVQPLVTLHLGGATAGLVVFYLFAQVVERVIEPFTEIDYPGRFQNRRFRTLFFGGVAGGMGVVAAYLTTGLFAVVGVTFVTNGRFLDAVLTGLLLTGGTKAVHDVISLLAGSAGTGND
jgi:hypothetical protein